MNIGILIYKQENLLEHIYMGWQLLVTDWFRGCKRVHSGQAKIT